MPFRKLSWRLIALLSFSLAVPSWATHLRDIEIQVVRNDCYSLTVEVIITAYTNYLNTQVKFGGSESYVDFGDGTNVRVPEIDHQVIEPDLYVGRARFVTSHTYSQYGNYKVSYREEHRNQGIANFDDSGTTAFYTETSILLEAGVCNSSPDLLVPPVDSGCTGVAFFHIPGAIDRDGDSLSFEFVIPQQAAGVPVTNYLLPDNPKFYSDASVPFGQGNEAGSGRPTISIDKFSGLIIWDAPGDEGAYVIAIKIREWKFNSSTHSWYEAGYMIRDMLIVVEDCRNGRPQLDVPAEMCVIAGEKIDLKLAASDPDNHNVAVEAFSDVFGLAENAAALLPPSGTLQSTNPPDDTAHVRLLWETTCAHVRYHPYKIVFKITDRPSADLRLTRFYTLYIKIIAPAPEYENVTINPATRQVTLQWKNSGCESVSAFQVWRRISPTSYEQPECETGMASSLRYQLMAELPSTELTFTDHDLAFGAQYCYRVLGLIGDKRIPGRVSIDTCLIPKPAEAPVIVNVSVQSTDSEEGEILVRWTKPFDIDQQQYPPPYRYKVFRKNDTEPQSSFQPLTAETLSDTVFTDAKINTLEKTYRYRVELYVPSLTTLPVDTSSQASSAFVRSKPIANGIQISWQANTPWSNYSGAHPYHLIYRSSLPSGPFTLIDSVNVNVNNFHYADMGTYDDMGLTGAIYYYKVKTRGTYGNPDIISPLENFTQITSGQVLDTVPPCKPVPEIAKVNCGEFPCDGSGYFTQLTWHHPDPDCSIDAVAYEVLVKDKGAPAYSSLGVVTESFFVHTNIQSLNKCYRIISLDEAGNRSDSSAVVCNSNCTNFKLPNVITPGLEDEKNDFLTTYPRDDAHREDCARSIRQVDIKIYSRWGHEIYTTSVSDEELPVFWNGLGNDGAEAASGSYFYHAWVTFDTNDPVLKKQQFKGWVQVIR